MARPARPHCDRRQDLPPQARQAQSLKALHTLSVYATNARLTLAQLSVPEKTNEITHHRGALAGAPQDLVSVSGYLIGSQEAGKKTDLSQTAASNEIIHDRYKDLALVEWAFRQSKTVHLEMRPIHVRLESRTRGHSFVVMLAYSILFECRDRRHVAMVRARRAASR